MFLCHHPLLPLSDWLPSSLSVSRGHYTGWMYVCCQVGEDEQKLAELCVRARKVQNSDEMVVTKAKKMGKELFAELQPDARKKMLDSIVCWLCCYCGFSACCRDSAWLGGTQSTKCVVGWHAEHLACIKLSVTLLAVVIWLELLAIICTCFKSSSCHHSSSSCFRHILLQ